MSYQQFEAAKVPRTVSVSPQIFSDHHSLLTLYQKIFSHSFYQEIAQEGSYTIYRLIVMKSIWNLDNHFPI